MSLVAAARLTDTVWRAATTDVDVTALPLVTSEDFAMLSAVNDGSATPAMWAAYDRAVAQRHGGAVIWPSGYAPTDNDGSDEARAAMLWYTRYYRIGRMIELIQSWKARPPRLAEAPTAGSKPALAPR